MTIRDTARASSGGGKLVRALVALALAGLAAAEAGAQDRNRSGSKFYPDFSDTADALLRNAANHARDRQWAEAVDIYQRVIQQFGDKVARLPRNDPGLDPSGESVLYVDVRQFCQRKLAALPPEARAIYRSRVDVQADRWFRVGVEGRDRASLRRVIDQAFCSSWGDDAAELLGDLAFQDGRFEEALSNYRRLVPEANGGGAGLVHPDPDVDLARVAAKKLLARAALGDGAPDPEALKGFARTYPGAKGSLAGREGPYLETLTEAFRSDRLAPPSQPDGRWPTFAGAPTRTRVVPGPIDVGSVQWRVDLKPPASERSARQNPRQFPGSGPTTADQKLAFHPIVLGDQVIVADESRVTAYNLNDRPEGSSTGPVRHAWRHDEDQGGVPQAPRYTLGVPRFTLTAHGDRIYARMGPTSVPYMGRMGGASPSYIVALDRATEGKLLWKRPSADVMASARPADGPHRTVGFEGTPVADGRNVYVAMTDRREQTSTYVAALDAETGATRWVRYLGAAPSENDNGFVPGGFAGGFGPSTAGDAGHRLLSLDGPTVYYQTNLGAVAALDAETGSIRWVASYPRIERHGSGPVRDLNPAVVHDGLVIVAPDDAASVYAFDANDGRLVWKTDPLPDETKLTHLLGVARGRLVATGDRVMLFDVKTGKLAYTWPDNGHGYEPYGRGVLAGEKIYWPTRGEVHVLDQATGLRTEPPIKLQETFGMTGGNLAVGDGYLIVAQAEQLVVFCQNRRLIQRYREEIARAPDQASLHYRMAQAAEATGQNELALEALDAALAKARASEVIDGGPLPDAARDQKFRLLMALGEQARASNDPAAAERRFRSAAGAARGDRDRLRARLAEADAQLADGRPERSVATLQALLAEGRLRSLTVHAEEGRRSVRADLLIADRLASVLKAQGRGVYEAFDRKARELLDAGRAGSDPRLLEEVARAFPAAGVVPDSLAALGAVYEAEKRPGDAARAYKRLLALAPTDALRARALLGLARSYEAQEFWVPARDAYSRALARFPEVPVDPDGPGAGRRVASVVAERLARPPYDRMAGDRAEPDVPVPLVRRWGKPLDGPVRPIAAAGVAPSAESSRIFLAQGGAIRPAAPPGDEPLWSADLGGAVVWAGYLDDRLVAATEAKVAALDPRTGAVLWQYEAGAPDSGRRSPNPFAGAPETARAKENAAGPPPGPLSGFRVVGGRVFCLRGDRELVAIDGDTGLVAWSYGPPGSINPNLWVGRERALLQTREPKAVVVLDTASGRRRAEFPQGDDRYEWAREPLPLDDDRVALVIDRRTVALFDLSRGANAWVFRESEGMPRNGPPRLFGDGERLLLVQDGVELIRLDAATGVKRWSRPLGIEDLSERPEALAVDGGRVYWAGAQTRRGPTLLAASLADGELAWSRHLSGPEMGWSVELTDRCVVAYPGLPRKSGNEIEGLPLVFRRRDTGELVQRLLFPVSVTDVAVRLSPRGALVATQGGLWALGERRAVDAPEPGR